ncbi:hypothetical protein ACLB2K_021426 [Fragaria x ananassa]
METLSFPSLLQLPCSPKNPRGFVDKEVGKNTVAAKNLHEGFPKRLPRRLLLQFMGFFPILSHPVLAAPMPEMKEPEVIRFHIYNPHTTGTLKLPSGVRIQEIVEGQGPAATEGDLVEINYVCRRTNGYFVHSTVDQFSGESTPVRLPLDEKQIIKGLEEVLVGMKIGGKRRALIPPSVGYTNESLQPIPEEFGPRRSLLSHVNEPLIFECCIIEISKPHGLDAGSIIRSRSSFRVNFENMPGSVDAWSSIYITNAHRMPSCNTSTYIAPKQLMNFTNKLATRSLFDQDSQSRREHGSS